VAYVVEGILFGLGLAIMLGPIFIALTQTSLEKGTLAGLLVGLGIWISDVIIILAAFFFINSLSPALESQSFKFYLGISGGIMLMIFGVVTMFSKFNFNLEKKKHSYRNLIGYWLKGFLVNTVNPFTFIVWFTLISSHTIGRGTSNSDTTVLLTSVMVTIVISNSLLVFAAKAIRKFLKEEYLSAFTKFSGVGLIICGIFLIFRSV